MTAQPWQPAKYPGLIDDVVDGRRVTLNDARCATCGVATCHGHPLKRLARILRPARTAQRDALLDRYRWANAGLRERLAELEADREKLLDALTDLADRHERAPVGVDALVAGLRAGIAEASR